MKTIYTSLPIYDNIAKQCYERIKKSKLDKLVPVKCPRHRLPSFQWLDDTDGAATVATIDMIKEGYTGSETAIVTTWEFDSFDDTFTHNGLNITQGKNVGAGIYQCYTDSFVGKVGDQIHIVGTMAGYSDPYPKIYLENDAGTQLSLTDGALDFTMTVKYPGTNRVYITGVGVIDFSFDVAITKMDDITNLYWHFPTIPALAVDYFTYPGDTLNYLLDAGTYYLKITTNTGHVYYSEWFEVDCVYNNLITEFTNIGYNTFTASGVFISSAIELAANGNAVSDAFTVRMGEVITVIFNLFLVPGTAPTVRLSNATGTVARSNEVLSINGANEITLISTVDGSVYLNFINGAATNFSINNGVQAQRAYSTKYLTINYSNTCDIGDLLYSEGMTQTIWFESETMEPSFPQEERGVNNGEERFVRTFARQTKKYLVRTLEMPDFMAEVFHRMKLHDSIEMIDIVGNENTMYNLEVNHEWLHDDKYLTRIDLTFDYDEAFVISGCCNNLT